jgi:hypothetical protein
MTSWTSFRAPLEVDRTSLLELARGGNLYVDRFAFLRELLQNAIDATLLRLFVERGRDAFPTHEGSMNELRSALAAYPIDVSIRLVEVDRLGPEPLSRYRVRVEDRGLGIAPRDFPHLQRIASSSKNPDRAALIAAMPEWMRPSGTFGIGLQSAFLVANELSLETRSLDGEAHGIALRASDGGSITVRESGRAEIGTCAELDAVVPLRWQSLARAPAAGAWAERDIVRDGWLDMQLESARMLARELGAAGHVPVRVEGAIVPPLFDGERSRFDPDGGLEVVLPVDECDVAPITAETAMSERFDLQVRTSLRQEPTTYYRGAPARLQLSGDADIRVRANVHVGTARDLLELSRDRFVAEQTANLSERFRAAVRRFGRAHLERLRAAGASVAVRCRTSLLLHECGVSDFGDEWRCLEVATRADGTPVDLGTLVDERAVEYCFDQPDGLAKRRAMELPSIRLASGDVFRSVSGTRDQRVSQFLPGRVHHSRERSVHRREPGIHFTLEHLREQLESTRHGVRPDLALPDDLIVLAVRPPDRDEPNAGWAVSPWKFVAGVVDVPEPLRWIEFVVANAATPGVSPDEVARALIRLLRLGDPVLRARPDVRVVYELDAVVAEIVTRHAGADA